MKQFRYTETATITISRSVLIEAEDNIEALEIVNETMLSKFNVDTDEVIDYKTDEWKLTELKDSGYTAPKFEPAVEYESDELDDGLTYCVYCYDAVPEWKGSCCGENHFLTGKEIKDYETH